MNNKKYGLSRALHKRIYMNPQANVYEKDPFLAYNFIAWKTDNPNSSCLFFSSFFLKSWNNMSTVRCTCTAKVANGTCKFPSFSFGVLHYLDVMHSYDQVQLYQHNELYWNIFTWSHTDRQPMKNNSGQEKTNDHDEWEKNHFSSKTKGRVQFTSLLLLLCTVSVSKWNWLIFFIR